MDTMDIYKFNYGNREIEFELEFSDRKTLGISVTPELKVCVTAPKKQKLDAIIKKVEAKAHWISKQQDFFEQYYPKETPRRYVSGETHRYLGKQYRLKLIQSLEQSVKLKGAYILIYTQDRINKETIKEQLENWYIEHAKIKFQQRLLFCYKKFQKYDVMLPEMQVRAMIRRWGSFTPAGKMILNSSLVKTPVYCIDYVITHELCHIKHFSHDNKFFNLITEIMPDWKLRKEKLDKFLW